MPSRASNQPSGRIRVQPDLPPLPADRLYAGIKKKPGPRRKSLAEVLRKPKEPTQNPHRSYSYGPMRFREPTRAEVAVRFRLPPMNLSRWKKEEEAGHYTRGVPAEASDGSTSTMWHFSFSNGWFRGFWMQFNRRNSQLRSNENEISHHDCPEFTVFADGIPRVKPLIFFRGKGLRASILAENWSLHMKANDITPSVIPGGCTGLVQPLDVLKTLATRVTYSTP